ncbi:Hypothetical predicted protein, partial [Pelobates cultripes]
RTWFSHVKEPPISQKRCGLGKGQKPYLIRRTLIRTRRKFLTLIPDRVDPVYSEDSSPERSVTAPPAIEVRREADKSTILDPQVEPLFEPDALHNLRLADWYPTDHVAKYIATRVRKPLDKATKSKLRAECPCPTVPDMACVTSDVDPKIAQFLGKSGWKAKKGLDYSLQHCQDKVLDVLGLVATIFDMV